MERYKAFVKKAFIDTYGLNITQYLCAHICNIFIQQSVLKNRNIHIYIYIALFTTNHIHRKKNNNLHTQHYKLQFVGGYQGRQSLVRLATTFATDF